METTLKESERFAVSGFNEALAKGDQLTDAEFKATVAKFAHLTGLDPKYVENSNLRVELMHLFAGTIAGQDDNGRSPR